MSVYENPSADAEQPDPDAEKRSKDLAAESQPTHHPDGGAAGAGTASAPDLATEDGGDATGGGSPGDPDAMGAPDRDADDRQSVQP